MPFRAWWYSRFRKDQDWPPDVRIYFFRRGVKTLGKVKQIPPEKQAEIATTEITAALSGQDLPPEFLEELLADGMQRLAEIPLEQCAACGRPVFTHEAIVVDGKPRCATCAGQNA